MNMQDFSFSNEKENELLWLINSISFDFTFVYFINDNCAKVTPYIEGRKLDDRYIEDFSKYLLFRVHPDDISVLENQIDHTRKSVRELSFEIRIREENGRRFRWHSVRMCLTDTVAGPAYAGSSSLIDNRKDKESELTIKARQDPLTGLLNKVVTTEYITSYINEHPNGCGAMIMLDIDNFKSYNDCMGHLFGDETIKEVSAKIRRIFSGDSYIGRIGGDEFVIFVKNDNDVSTIVNRLWRLKDSLNDITLGQASRINITTSIGISFFPEMGRSYDELFQAADMALYYVKGNGKNNFAFYTEELYDESVLKDGEKRLDELREESYTLTNFAFHLLNESEDVTSALNLLLYKLQNEYDLEAIFVNELNPRELNTTCTYEIKKNSYPSRLGQKIEFSHQAWKATCDSLKVKGYKLYDLKHPEIEIPGNGAELLDGAASMLQADMRLFSKTRGCIDFISRYGSTVWTKKKIDDILAITNIITVCLYYTGKVNRAKDEITRFTEYDALTGLMKEDNFIDAATRLIKERGKDSKLSIVYLDISNFKYINEAYGYITGDHILADVADFISHKISNVLCTGRFYSDNILFMLENDRETPNDELLKYVDTTNATLSDYLSRKYSINNISVRSGIYVIPDSTTEVLQSISNANMARKIAKSGNGSRCVIFNNDMFEKRKKQIRYIQRLDESIAKEEFYVVLQPKVSGTTNRLVGAEALVRWRPENGPEIYPDEFVPAFEKDGSIVKLDFYVYEKVMQYIRGRLDNSEKVLPISMNVSRAHLHTPDFAAKFLALVTQYHIPTEYLELELTESIYLENLSYFNSIIEPLRAAGIKISMDDFGSGYSSLNALNDLKIDLLKIDRIFMKEDNLKDSDKTIIRFIVDMAKTLSMQVLCEGVETPAQREFLNETGCDLHQGYLYSKPVNIATFNDFIAHEEQLFKNIG